MSHQTIPFIVAVDPPSGAKGRLTDAADIARAVDVPADALARSLEAACRPLAQAFTNLTEVGDFRLGKVTIGLEISAEGGVSFIGTAKVGAKAAITLEFEPPKPT